MSESYHQGVYLFSDGFERSTHQEHQYRKRDKLMVQGFDAAPPPLVAIEEEEEFKAVPAYESGGMLSEMFNFPASDLLESQIPTNYRPPRPTNNVEWYGTKHGAVGSLDSFGDSKQHIRYSNNNNGLDDNIAENEISVINANSTSSMQLFLMNPQQRSPSPPPPPPPPASNHSLQIFRNSPIQQQQFTWGETAAALDNENKIQGLSLSLSSSLQQFEVAKAAGQLRMGGDGRFYYNQGVNTYPLKSFGDQAFHFQGGGHSHEFHNGFGSLGEVGFLRSSKYVKAAQELLEEFCSVGKGLLKKRKLGRQNPNPNLADVAMSSSDVGCVGVSSSSSRDLPPLSPSERFEHQKRKAKFLSMLDEVDGRYNNYIEQLQMVVNSFDSVLGFGAASPYTALTQKAMSRHFRCLKDAISVQLKLVCELLGDKEGAVKPPGITKGETPRLRFLEQCLRQQRSFNQIGMMEHEAWRPQRGLPERSVNILRAWLFEHFLHPYPSDADKHLLARRTGLSRNQVRPFICGDGGS